MNIRGRTRWIAGVTALACTLLGAIALYRWRAAPIATAAAAARSSSSARAVQEPRSREDAAEVRRERNAMRDRIVRALERRGFAAPPTPIPSSPRPAAASDNQSAGHYEPEYIHQVFRDDLFPLVK